MQVGKWGNSLAVRRPASVVELLGLKDVTRSRSRSPGERNLRVGRDRSREEALERLKALSRPLPPGFKFDRDEANER